MEIPRKIVVGLSMSNSLLPVLDEAIEVARLFGSELCFAHAIDEVSPLSTDFDVLAEQVEETFAGLRARAKARGVQVDPVDWIRHGTPDEVLERVAEDLDADWILAGAGNRTPLDRLFDEANAESLLRTAVKPVWIVRPASPLRGLERIVCAVDESEPARCAALLAAALAQRVGASLTLLAVGPRSQTQPLTRRLTRSLGAQRLKAQGGCLGVATLEGDPLHEILSHVGLTHADLLVLGCAGRRGLRRLLHRNTSERLARRISCAVLSVPSLAHAPSAAHSAGPVDSLSQLHHASARLPRAAR